MAHLPADVQATPSADHGVVRPLGPKWAKLGYILSLFSVRKKLFTTNLGVQSPPFPAESSWLPLGSVSGQQAAVQVARKWLVPALPVSPRGSRG